MRTSFRQVVAVLLLLTAALSGCTKIDPTPTRRLGTASPTAVGQTTPSLPPTPQKTETAVPILSLTATPVHTSPPLRPSPSPIPHKVEEIRAPLVVDSARGRLYAAATVDGQEQIVALAARDGRLVATYSITGSFAVDGEHGWLYVDLPAEGLVVLDLQTGEIHTTVPLPMGELWQAPGPVADPATGAALAFRNNQVWIIDPREGTVLETIVLDIERDPGSCGTSEGGPPIEQVAYSAQRRILHAEFLTYVCTPWTGFTIVSYDVEAREEIGRQRGSGPTGKAIAHNGYLYGSSWYRLGFGSRWARAEGQPAVESSHWQGGYVDYVLDASRQRLYEPTGSYLRVFDPETMVLKTVIESPMLGQLVGHDPGTDQLYFLSDGQLQLFPAGELSAPGPTPWVPTEPPTTPVRSLIVSPGWRRDRTLFGVWEVTAPSSECWVLGQRHGLLLISHDGGGTWLRPGGLEHACGYVTTLAVSAAYTDDQTLLAGLPGLGLWESTDAGQSWQPRSGNLPSMGITQILLSPAFSLDETVYVRTVVPGEVYRSTEGGVRWEALNLQHLQLVDMSFEFAQDRALMGMAWVPSSDPAAPPNELLLSPDGGDHWHHAGELGASRMASLLSMAPLFSKWQTVFVHGDDGWLYRSANGGAHWEPVLRTLPPEEDPFSASPRLLYAPGMEENRSVFLLVTQSEYAAPGLTVMGQVYRSDDGGQSWQELDVPQDVRPTALTMSPDFQADHLLFLGTTDGRVVMWPVAAQAGQ